MRLRLERMDLLGAVASRLFLVAEGIILSFDEVGLLVNDVLVEAVVVFLVFSVLVGKFEIVLVE